MKPASEFLLPTPDAPVAAVVAVGAAAGAVVGRGGKEDVRVVDNRVGENRVEAGYQDKLVSVLTMDNETYQKCA
jgi:hypothetical protein